MEVYVIRVVRKNGNKVYILEDDSDFINFKDPQLAQRFNSYDSAKEFILINGIYNCMYSIEKYFIIV